MTMKAKLTTTIRIGAAHCGITLTNKGTKETASEDLSDVYRFVGHAGVVKATGKMVRAVGLVCDLHGIKEPKRKKSRKAKVTTHGAAHAYA